MREADPWLKHVTTVEHLREKLPDTWVSGGLVRGAAHAESSTGWTLTGPVSCVTLLQYGLTPAHLCAQGGHFECLRAILDVLPEAVNLTDNVRHPILPTGMLLFLLPDAAPRLRLTTCV